MLTIDLTNSPPELCAKGNEDEGSITITSTVLNNQRGQRGSKRSQKPNTAPQSRSSSLDRKDVDMRRTRRKINHNMRETGEDTRYENNEDLFFVDLNPDAVPSTNQDGQNTASVAKEEKLLLPSHVTVLGNMPVEIIEIPFSVSKEENFIKYLDYEDTKDAVRYFHEPLDEAAILDRTVCKNCGAEGQHKTSACPVQICLTCGARDEHSTRSCPISKVCFTCGMKGHINANCPNRRVAKALISNQGHECDRCTASTHQTNECPTWWRLYEYVNDEDRIQLLVLRQTKKDMKLGEGGEGYIADDEWCYNCGDSGHWGDNCDANFQSPEYSAFSNANVMRGPFFNPDAEPQTSSSRSLVRDWPQFDKLSVPGDVGRKGRLKSKAALQRQANQAENDPEDWFSNSTRPHHNGSSYQATTHSRSPKKLSFKPISHNFERQQGERHEPPSLLERMGLEDSRSNRRTDKRERRDRSSNGSRYKDDSRSSGNHVAKPYVSSGPRYRGGYGK